MTPPNLRPAVAAAAALCLCAPIAAAQSQPGAVSAPWSYAAWGGVARNSPDNLWGAERGRDVAVAALRFTRQDTRSTAIGVDYYLDVVPVAWVSMPRTPDPPPCDSQYPKPHAPAGGSGLCILDGPVKTSAYGLGVAPLGVQARVRLLPLVQPFVAMNAGMLWFTRPVPSERAARLNFTADAGAGLLIGRRGQRGVMLGYKFHHISNGGTAASNPGIDGHMIYAGLLRVPR